MHTAESLPSLWRCHTWYISPHGASCKEVLYDKCLTASESGTTLYTSLCTYLGMWRMCVCVDACMHVYVCVCIPLYVHMQYVQVCTCMSCVSIALHIHYTYVCVHMCLGDV